MKWPDSLAHCRFITDDFSEQFAQNAIRTDMDQGPAFQRPMYGANFETRSVSMQLSKAEYIAFKQFWRDTSYGAVPFDWVDPITEEPATVQFDVSKPPFLTAISGLLYSVSLKIEILP